MRSGSRGRLKPALLSRGVGLEAGEYGPKKTDAWPPLRGTLEHRRLMGKRGKPPVTQRNGVRADRAPLSTFVSAPSDPGAQ